MDVPGRRANTDTVRPGRVSSLISAYEALLDKNFVEVEPEEDDDQPENTEKPKSDEKHKVDEKPKDDVLPDASVVPAVPVVIKVKKVNLDIRNNTVKHHTDEFEITDCNEGDNREFLVVRRGQTFTMNVEFNREYNKENDDLRIVFQFGTNPLPNRGTHAEFMLSDKDVTDKWGAYIQSQDSKSISLVLMTPPTCPVGKWRMNIDVVKQADNKTTVYRHAHPDLVYILFNPWCDRDLVYFHEKEDKLLNEYVLKETGNIYSGNFRLIGFKPWNFGQFTGNVLDCIIYLLEKSSLQDHLRGDPVLVSRKLSALINSTDESGVLTGNWSGNYGDCTSPLDWSGSVAILEEYFETKKPVCYGQCWVFSGLLTTACRALGIPARSVTNFASAHDTDGSVTIDDFVDKTGEPVDALNGDSTWNFHCWNDAWMARPDLPPGYGGWQAIDATPQESSGGVYCMGPMSLVAIKRGEAYLPYDGKFVFAEVNADKVYWVEDEEDGEYKVSFIVDSAVGKNMSTLKPLSHHEREDVTDQYKFADGSVESRAAVLLASIASSADREVYKIPTVEDVEFDMDTSKESFMGDDIEVSLKMKSNSTEDRTINGTFKLSSMYYTGVLYKEIEKQKIKDLILKPDEEKLLTIKVTAKVYLEKLMDHCMCRVSGICSVKETKQLATGIKETRLRKPHLDVKAPETAFVGERFPVQVSFKNPLHVSMTKCELRVEGPHLQRPIIYKHADVAPKEPFTGSFEMTPVKAGEREVIIYFNCAQISGVTASHEFKIKQK